MITFSTASECIQEGMQPNGNLPPLHIGAQLYVWRNGQVLWNQGFGEARPGLMMTPATPMVWFSSCKPLTAAAIGKLVEWGELDWHDRVIDYIPEFHEHGKDIVTIYHLLTHTGGFRFVDTGWPHSEWSEIIRRLCHARLEKDWIPGHRAGYHATSSWYILGEILRRIDGKRSIEEFIRDEILLPCGMKNSWMALEESQVPAVDAVRGVMQITGKPDSPKPFPDDLTQTLTRVRPGGSGHGPIGELGLFYQMLLNQGLSADGQRHILLPQTVHFMTTRRRIGMMDESFKHIVDWGLGFAINSYVPPAPEKGLIPYQFGPCAGRNTFGHGGMQSSIGLCDPNNRLVIAAVFNGCPGERAHNQRMHRLLTAIYEDMELAHQ